MKNEYDYLNDAKIDFDRYDETAITEREICKMKNSIKRHKRPKKYIAYAVAACLGIVALTGTAFASGLVDNIVKVITTGHNKYYQVDSSAPMEVPENLRGRLFDKNGVPLTEMTAGQKLYDADGNEYTPESYAKLIEEVSGGTVEISGYGDPSENELVYDTLDKAQAAAKFDIKTPSALPDNFSLSRVYTFTDENGNTSGMYMNMVYSDGNGREIIFMERLINDETSFESGTDGKIEEIKINGRTAVISAESVAWETADMVSVSVFDHAGLSREELIKLAESVK